MDGESESERSPWKVSRSISRAFGRESSRGEPKAPHTTAEWKVEASRSFPISHFHSHSSLAPLRPPKRLPKPKLTKNEGKASCEISVFPLFEFFVFFFASQTQLRNRKTSAVAFLHSLRTVVPVAGDSKEIYLEANRKSVH